MAATFLITLKTKKMKTLQEISTEITRNQNRVRYYKDLYLIGATEAHFTNVRVEQLETKIETLQEDFDKMYKYNNNEKL